jgi:nitrate reductase NapD
MINLLENDPVHIAGVLIKAFPHNIQVVTQRLTAFPGTEVHEVSPEGNMVITVEATAEEKNVVDIITQLSVLEGVLDASLIFHHNDVGLVPHARNTNGKINFK